MPATLYLGSTFRSYPQLHDCEFNHTSTLTPNSDRILYREIKFIARKIICKAFDYAHRTYLIRPPHPVTSPASILFRNAPLLHPCTYAAARPLLLCRVSLT